MKIKLFTFTLLSLAVAGGQTTVKLPQLRGPAGVSPTVGVISPDGNLAIATIGEGVSLVQNPDGTYTLSAAGGALEEKSTVLTRSGDGSYTIPDIPKGVAKVYRNGLLQSVVANPNVAGSQPDYTILGSVIRGTAAASWQAGDMIVAVYFR